MSKWRGILQIVFLALFVFLIVSGRMQVWMIITLAAVLAATLAGRFYCGYICPMFTATRPGETWKKRIKRKGRQIPRWAKSPYFRPVPLVLLVAVIALTAAAGVEFPFFIVLIVLAVIISLFYDASLWHRYLCPFGTLFSLTSRFSRTELLVNKEKCNACGLCDKNCPGEAINVDGDGKREIDPRYCLLCMKCQEVCRREAISFQWAKGKSSRQANGEEQLHKVKDHHTG